ncbi:hypothetical protein D3C72_2317560 [compost metagenome]
MAGTHFIKQRQAISARQPNVAENQLGSRHVQLCQGSLGRCHRHHVMTRPIEAQGQQPKHVGVIVHDQDAGAWGCAGGCLGGHGVFTGY